MKKLNLANEYETIYKGSDLQKIMNNSPLPIKYTIDGTECYFFNPDLFGLFELRISKNGLTSDDFAVDYKNGFIKGLRHLKKVEEIRISDLRGEGLKEGTILQLKHLLHKREFKDGTKGLLKLVFGKIPLIFTDKNIYDYGYWNAIIYSINDLCEKVGIKEDDLKSLQSIDVNQNRTKKVITETIENMDKKGWEYAFTSEQDYNLFTDLLTNFFEYKDYSIPETVIQLKRTCKTKVAKALGEIHAELSENPLNSDAEYFEIVKILNHFKEVSTFDLVKAMQR